MPAVVSVPDCGEVAAEELSAGGVVLAAPAPGAVALRLGLLLGHGVVTASGFAAPSCDTVTVLVAPGPGVTESLSLGEGSVVGDGSVVGPAVPVAGLDEPPAGAEDAGAEAAPVREGPSWVQVEAAGLECRVPPVDALLAPETRPEPADPPALLPFGLVPL